MIKDNSVAFVHNEILNICKTMKPYINIDIVIKSKKIDFFFLKNQEKSLFFLAAFCKNGINLGCA
ncbi:hypothetical protein AAX08_03180 [Moraxella bovoculi]|nr:hypothetical protein AAX08_03180 [Moraxella bovoculi]